MKVGKNLIFLMFEIIFYILKSFWCADINNKFFLKNIILMFL
jgi:hypothetical protein